MAKQGLPQTARFSDHSHPIKMVSQLYETYDFDEFTVATGITDYDVKTQRSAMFYNIKNAWLMILEYNKDISIKFNSTDMPAMSISMETSPREYRDIFKMTNLYITNASGATVTVRILLV